MALLCNFTVPMDCNSCYELTIQEPCPPVVAINLQVGLPHNTAVYLFLIDKFNNVWCDSIQTAQNGSMNLTLSHYPKKFFNKYAGFFRIFVAYDNQGTNIVPLVINQNMYACIIMGFCYASFP